MGLSYSGGGRILFVIQSMSILPVTLRESRRGGSQVALDPNNGIFLFKVSQVFSRNNINWLRWIWPSVQSRTQN